jgi:hypothetical protein
MSSKVPNEDSTEPSIYIVDVLIYRIKDDLDGFTSCLVNGLL